MEKVKFIWLNGRLVKWEKANVHLLAHALHYGSGAFEGIRFYKTPRGPAVFRLDDHLNRLSRSFSIFGGKMPYSERQIKEAVKETIRANKIEQGYIRPIVFYGYGEMGLANLGRCKIDTAVAIWPWGAYLGSDPIAVKLSKFIRFHPKSVVSEAKISGYYVNSILAGLDAKKDGYHEALLLDYKGNLAEGPGENIFVVKRGALSTPALGCILPGITRMSVMKIAKDMGIRAREKKMTPADVYKADEAFFVGSAAEVTPIGRLNRTLINKGRTGEITKKIAAAYQAAVHGENAKYEGWLTYVY